MMGPPSPNDRLLIHGSFDPQKCAMADDVSKKTGFCHRPIVHKGAPLMSEPLMRLNVSQILLDNETWALDLMNARDSSGVRHVHRKAKQQIRVDQQCRVGSREVREIAMLIRAAIMFVPSMSSYS